VLDILTACTAEDEAMDEVWMRFRRLNQSAVEILYVTHFIPYRQSTLVFNGALSFVAGCKVIIGRSYYYLDHCVKGILSDVGGLAWPTTLGQMFNQ
jgi:hypothetical protein